MPNRVYLGFTSHPVEEYFGAPIQCYQCQRFGHIAQNCRSARRCKICAGPHHHKDCNYRSEPNCANCGCSHAATYAGCSSKKAATALRKQEILNGRAPNRRSPTLNPETVHQPETPSQKETSTPKKDRTYSRVLQRPSKKQANTTSDSAQCDPKTYAPLSQRTSQPSGSPVPTASVAGRDSRPSTSHAKTSTTCDTDISGAGTSATPPYQGIDQQLLLQLVFLAVKAIIKSLPDALNISEVKTLLAMEPLLLASNRSI